MSESLRFTCRQNRILKTLNLVPFLSEPLSAIKFPEEPVILCFLCALMAIPLQAAPRMVCDAPKYDFGSVIGSEKITHEFILSNRGDSPVVISKIKNCCGVQSSITPMEILPGSNVVCKVVFTTRNRYGPQDKQILIASNDRQHPYFELKMVGTLLKPVEFSPRLVRFGTLLPDSEINQTITATNLLEKPVVLESVDSKIKGIEAIVVGLVDPSARQWNVHLRSSEPLPVGKLNGQIQLNFSSGSVMVPVVGTVKPILQVVPEQIQISSQSTREIERLVMVRSSDDRAFEVLSAKLVDSMGSVKIKKLTESRWQFRVRLVPSSVSPNTYLKIETSGSGASNIRIPIHARGKA